MKQTLLILTAALSLPFAAAQTGTLAPAFGDTLNLKTPLNVRDLNRDTFYKVIVPLARKEGSLTLYNFAASFPPLWKEVVIPRFQQKYGIKVNFYDTTSDVADQQLVAAHRAGQSAPTDVYFAPGGKAGFYKASGVLANLPLYALLPEARLYQKAAATSAVGVQHGGSFMPFHRNQTAIAYNSALVKAADVPRTFPALLAWAKKNPGKLAITSALKGGSGGGFAMSAASALMGASCKAQFMDQSVTADAAAQWVKTSGCLNSTWTYLKAINGLSEVTNGNNDTYNLIANNAASMGTVWEDGVYTYVQRRQLPDSVRLTLLSPGEVGGGDGLFVTADAPHPAAAMLFIDFALSADIQTWKLENMASRSVRLGIGSDKITGKNAQNLLPGNLYPKFSLSWPADAMQVAFRDAYAAQVLGGR
ncbi:extracellular solute-binding protein [Deinococcus gobiensis]|uniref:ABC transporter, substrate binding protein n=1 Tax=Deinococcus gobiensis (strain DSM 21396 / JCM 16679 / CGMCC 1.7299 / I-0) TaxID=745776 RepID=H8H248_DEIGI|nr:extracellular solute-binding protein [Deinococcus gobiensis]AFD27595.1 ABC transporter, substrate binding protein [Deinococcus gobiensis I-0]